ncbi:hypothetical protein EYR41_004317 [Orbilia oligospora]|uniref:Uncharacterized protein n=1 Tax=Orbilia oligospora TaxID=2813651 RepID=A0A7C8PIV0_ORBOL|nr:hypothetical protein TWF751_005138 [Orbilia oligospora]TGJ72421.1 hypothetical protein EYR41_004317 [Orbilia oligospora]
MRLSNSMLTAYSQSLIPLLLSSFPSIINSQSTTLTTSTTTETWILKDITFSTVVTYLPWCPLPSAGAAVSASGPIVVQLSFRANVTDGSDSGDGVVTFVMDRNGNDIVVSNNPLILSLNTSFVLQEFSNTPQVLYFSLPTNLTSTNHKLGKRFDELLPVFVSDQVPSDAIFEGWFEDIDGEFFIRVSTSEGELILGFTVCPTDGTAASGQKVYVYDLSLGVPNTDQCIRAAANTLPYPLWTASATSLPTGISIDPFNPEDGATTPTTGSRTSRRTSMRSSSATTTDSDTSTNTITSRTPTNTGMSITSTSSSRRTSSSSDISDSSSISSNSSTSDTRIYTTTTFWTTGVPDGTTSATSTTDAADATVTVSEYQPYPSSIKIVSTRDGETSSAIYYIKAIFSGNWLPIPPSTYEDPIASADLFLLNMVWVLNSEGHLFSPIYGPRTVQGEWQGLGYNYTIPNRVYIVGSKTTAMDIPDFSGMIIRVKTFAEMVDTDVLLSFNITSSGLLTLNSAVNTTAGYGIWACEETGQHWGITDGSDRYCQWDKITTMHMQGNPALADSDEAYYGFVTVDATYTAGLGDGPTVTRHKFLPKSVTTATLELTAGDAYYLTVGTGLKVPTATITFGQRVERSISSNAWNITASISSTVINPSAPTKTVIEYLAPSGHPMYRMFWTGGATTDQKYFALSTDTTTGNQLLLYGDANTDPDTQRIAEFWTTPNGNDLIARGYNSTHRYLDPTYAYFDSASNGIKFYPFQQNPSGTELMLFDFTPEDQGSGMQPRPPSNAVNWGSGDLALWMCGKGGTTYPSGPNAIYLGNSETTTSALKLAADCAVIGDSFANTWHYENGIWSQGTYWKRDEDGAWRNDDGVAYHELVASGELS